MRGEGERSSQVAGARYDGVDAAYDRLAGALHQLALLTAGDRAVADAAVSRAFLDLWHDPTRVAITEPSLDVALAGGVYRHCAVARATDDAPGHDPGDPQSPARAALARLPPPQRDLLALILFGGHTQPQAARRVGLDEDAAAPLITAALRDIRDGLDATREVNVTEPLQAALSNRVAIERAEGVIAERADIAVDAASARLRAYARARNRRVSDIARELIGGGADAAAALPHPLLGAVRSES